MNKKKRYLLILSLMLTVCCTLPVNAAARFKKVPADMRGAVKVSSAAIREKKAGRSRALQKLRFGEKIRILGQSEKWYEIKKGSVKGYMKKSDVVMYNKEKKHIALTFDDGPGLKTTPKVLNALKKNKCRATFFLVGSSINSSTGNLLKREAKLGCETGNHSYSHPLLTGLGSAAVRSQFSRTNKNIKKYTGRTATVCRTPYGSSNVSVLGAAGCPHILWSVDTLDWKYRNTGRLISYVNSNARDGAIVLMHDIHMSTANAVDSICKNLKKKGYEMVTVTELAAIKGKTMRAGRTYYSF